MSTQHCWAHHAVCIWFGVPWRNIVARAGQTNTTSCHHHHQFLLSVWRIGPEIMLLQDTLFAAANPALTQELKPIAILSFSTVLLRVSLGLPHLRFPSGAHVRAPRGRQLLSMRSTYPIHIHLFFLTSSLMVRHNVTSTNVACEI